MAFTHAPYAVPVLGFCAYSGVGKTHLLEYLLPLLRAWDLRVGLLKHSHHALMLDQAGKDSYRLAAAGANPVLLASEQQRVLIQRLPDAVDTDFGDLVDCLCRCAVPMLDLILVEGFKHQPIAKIELHRPVLQHPLLCRTDATVIALATDAPIATELKIPVLDLNNPPQIADFIRTSFLPLYCAFQESN